MEIETFTCYGNIEIWNIRYFILSMPHSLYLVHHVLYLKSYISILSTSNVGASPRNDISDDRYLRVDPKINEQKIYMKERSTYECNCQAEWIH